MLLLSACASTPTRPAGEDPVVSVPADASIAGLLERAAGTSGGEAAELYLTAAWRYFDTGELEATRTTLDRVDANLLLGTALTRYQLLAAELALAAGDLEAAEFWLATIAPDPGQDQRAAARLCALKGDFICAANGLIASANGNVEDNDRIWRYLGLAPGLAVADQAQRAAGTARGWWQLKAAMLRAYSAAERRAAVDFWRRAHRDHPASVRLPDALQGSLDTPWQPRQVALLLPLSGPLAGAGEAVRDGFVSAYLTSATPDLRVRFYDTEAAPLPQLLENILVDGADVLIGPLRKEQLQALTELNPELPTLGLNYLDDGATGAPQLLQLGLAIEDEASTIARELNARGVESAVVLHSFEDWSLRARRQLTNRWQGRATVQPLTDIRTITEAVGSAMKVEDSQSRHEALAELLGTELEFLPRARQDVDAVVALIDNVEANALAPALRFHFADHLPVYACSQVVRGASRDQLAELEGFQVSELPWFLREDSLYESMAQPFALEGNRFSSLHALGVDALRVTNLLGILPRDGTSVLVGSTGALALDPDGRFRRQLDWGVVRSGGVTARAAALSDIGD